MTAPAKTFEALRRYLRHPLNARTASQAIAAAKKAIDMLAISSFGRTLSVSVEIRGMELSFSLGGLSADEEIEFEKLLPVFEKKVVAAIEPVITKGIERRVEEIGRK